MEEINQSNNQIDIGKKVWYNKVIRNEILKWNRCLSKVNDWRIYEFKSLESYEQEKDNYFIKSIIMINCFNNTASSASSLIQFLNQLPSNIESVEFKQISKVQIDIKTIVIPPTLKTIKFDNNITLIEEDSHKTYETEFIKDLSSLSYQLNGLKSLYLGFRAEEVMISRYLPYTLKHLTLSCLFKDPILNLPDTLDTLIILSEYDHLALKFPRYLKYFSYGKNYSISLSVLKDLPASIEILRLDAKFQNDSNNYDGRNLKFFKSLTNLKSLTVSNQIYTRLFYSLFLMNESVFKQLDNLEIVRRGFFTIGSLDIDVLPSTLVKAKLPNSFFQNNKIGRGYSASLKSLETSLSGLRFPFENASNIESLSILMKDEKNLTNFIDLEKFPNLKSLKYQLLEVMDESLLPSSSNQKIINLELSCTESFKNSQQPIKFTRLNHLKSIKLDATYSVIQFQTHTILDKPASSYYPTSVKLLMITSTSPLIISNQNLPPSLQILIIRGTTLPTFVLPLPETLESIYISNSIKININHPIINSLNKSNVSVQMYYNENDKKYYSDSTYSKLYNNIKNNLII